MALTELLVMVRVSVRIFTIDFAKIWRFVACGKEQKNTRLAEVAGNGHHSGPCYHTALRPHGSVIICRKLALQKVDLVVEEVNLDVALLVVIQVTHVVTGLLWGKRVSTIPADAYASLQSFSMPLFEPLPAWNVQTASIESAFVTTGPGCA